MFLSITRMVVPVLLMFLLGWFCHWRRIISAEGLKGIKDLVSSVLLPVVLFVIVIVQKRKEEQR